MSNPFDACTESRFLAATELDDELSELDAARLRAHLEACPECKRWAAEVAALTVLLRRAALDKPVLMPWVTARRLDVRRAAAVAAGATASVAAAALVVFAVAFPAARYPGFQDHGVGSSLSVTRECAACDAARAFVDTKPAPSTALPAQPSRHHPEPT